MGPGTTGNATRPTRPNWVPNDLYPFEDRWAEIGGNLVHYVDEGDGPALLLLHSNPSWSFGWRDVILGLRDRYRASLRTTRGSGCRVRSVGYDFRPRTHSAVVEGLVDRLGLHGIVVFGYAWGGPIGIGLAGRRPELVRGLVIANTWASPDDRLRARLFGALMGGPLSPLLVERLNLMLRLYLPSSLKRGRLTDAERAAYEGPFPPGARSTMRVLPREIVRGRAYLREVEASLPVLADMPAIILWADSDPGFDAAVLRRWQSLYPAAPTMTLEHAGQYIDEDAPEDIVAALSGWLAGLPGQEA